MRSISDLAIYINHSPQEHQIAVGKRLMVVLLAGAGLSIETTTSQSSLW